MKEFQEKRRRWKFLYSPLLLLAILALVVLTGRGAWNIYQKARETGVNKRDVEARVRQLEERGSFLSREIDRLSTEVGVEREIRQRFNVKKSGEEVVIIVETAGSSSPETSGYSIFSWFEGLFK